MHKQLDLLAVTHSCLWHWSGVLLDFFLLHYYHLFINKGMAMLDMQHSLF